MEPVGKTQFIRIMDVVFIGPAMMYGGHRLMKRGDRLLGNTLAVLGMLTVVYNAKNYRLQEDRGHE